MAKKQVSTSKNPWARLTLLVVLVAALVIVMVYGWRYLPIGQLPIAQDSQIIPPLDQSKPEMATRNAEGMTKQACEQGGGSWTDCASPCRGMATGTTCVEVCVPQCICGGTHWLCPKDYVCDNYLPDAKTKNAVGVCRKGKSEIGANSTSTRATPPGMVCDTTNSICASASLENSLLASPFVATGTAVAFEQQFSWKLLDGNGATLEQGSAMTHAPDAGIPGPYEIRAFILSVPKTATGTLVLYEASAKDGSPIHTVRIPVQLPRQSMAVKVYLSTADTETECGASPDTQYVVRTSLPIEATLRKLLHPELGVGTGTNIPTDTELRSIKVSGGTATVIFNPQLERGGGACHVQSVRTQIESTLKQFPAVKSVVISVEGKTPAETLQP